MKVLHIASFQGNVGDQANHNGLLSVLRSVLTSDFIYDRIEIRRFYRNYDGADGLSFDDDLAEHINQYDLLIIGGGNFFEIWLEDSTTGCTIDIPDYVLDRISTKILFFGLGFDTYKGKSPSTIDRFGRFLARITSSNQFLVTVRNDGSQKQLRACYEDGLVDRVVVVPDGGFFLPIEDLIPFPTETDMHNYVMSIACDMLHVRFPDKTEKDAKDHLASSFVKFITHVSHSDPKACFVLVPHIYSDIQIMGEILAGLPDYLRRTRMVVGPLLAGTEAYRYTFGIYGSAFMVISMRFHGNVVPLGLGIRTIGVSSYRKISDLFEEQSIMQYVVDARPDDFAQSLIEKVDTLGAIGGGPMRNNGIINREEMLLKLKDVLMSFLSQ